VTLVTSDEDVCSTTAGGVESHLLFAVYPIQGTPSMASPVDLRIRDANFHPVRRTGCFVLYWMTAARRRAWNFSLQRAVDWAREFRVPLLVLETLPVGLRWDCDRRHRFALDGMAENARRFARSAATYYPFVERSPGEATALVAALAELAVLVVADDWPTPWWSCRVTETAAALPCFAELVDSCGLLPLRAADRAFPTAYAFRRFLQRELPAHLAAMPAADPLARRKLPPMKPLPREIPRRWPAASAALMAGRAAALAQLPIDHSTPPVATRGGEGAGRAALDAFLNAGCQTRAGAGLLLHREGSTPASESSALSRYAEDRNHPDLDATSGLAPYLGWGHVSPHEIVSRILQLEDWTPERLGRRVDGRREGWWGVRASAEAFLDQLVTWRELGYHTAARDPHCDRFESLPEWSRRTLAKHARDRRETVYSLAELTEARTHDALWNAAQRQLVREGRLHNYLRMLWGKKILQWSPSPEEALDRMIELNNRYALDGCDPNSVSGIFWTLGRYDRPWGPERPVFGTVRYMSSENTARKVRVRRYLEAYGG
jgi:deoxyribodipyrimidine photo-lyase